MKESSNSRTLRRRFRRERRLEKRREMKSLMRSIEKRKTRDARTGKRMSKERKRWKIS